MAEICFNCFRNKPDGGVCPFCGYDHTGSEEKFPLALKPGTVLANRYYLGRVLGQGGFGITYIALDGNTQSRVAIKEYLPRELAMRDQNTQSLQIYSANDRENYEYGKQQFLDEAKTLAQFYGNEHIISIQGYFEENGTAYFAMEYMEGVNLKQYMEQLGRPLEVYEANRILLPVMESLEWVHSKGIIHRDISPDNIMIRRDGTAKLIDFGAARYSTGEVSRSLDVILKHGFAPKEQYTRRGRQGPFTDVYSMAATYYYAITGKVPPDAIERTEEDELIRPSALGVEIRNSTEAALLKALAISASDRWQTMREFYSAMVQSMPNPFQPEAASGIAAGQQQENRRQNMREKPTAEKRPHTGSTSNSLPSGSKAHRSDSTASEKQAQKKKNPAGLIAAAVIVLAAVIALVMILPRMNSKSSVAKDENTPVAEGGAVKITVTGSAMGIDGPVEVQVVADANTIYSVEVTKQNETMGIGSVAVEQLPGEMVKKNTYNVDSIAGASVTSAAIRNAVKMALESAGFDPDAYGAAVEPKRSSMLLSAEVGEHVTFGTYEQDNNLENGKEDIEWLVLAKEDTRLLVISRYALDCQQYCTTYYIDDSWETRSLRGWLNESFLNTAFKSEEQKLIPTVTVRADKNPYFSTDPGNNTEDQIFLLSIPEVNKYLTSDDARKCVPTAYAESKGAYTNNHYMLEGKATCWWWLRSPGSNSDSAAHVYSDGSINYNGELVRIIKPAVRPAMWINLES